MTTSSRFTAFKWNVQRFTAVVLWNANIKKVASSTFGHGLAGAIYLNQEDLEEVTEQTMKMEESTYVVLVDCYFHDIEIVDGSYSLLHVEAGTTACLWRCVFSDCCGVGSNVCWVKGQSVDISRVCVSGCVCGVNSGSTVQAQMCFLATGMAVAKMVTISSHSNKFGESLSGDLPMFVTGTSNVEVSGINLSGGSFRHTGGIGDRKSVV